MPFPNHDININFLHIKEDPNCRFALYLDNVSVEPIIYVPDYYINTSSDPNGSITHGSTIPQGSNIDIYITPNSGYEILDVVVDGISVGPVKYYSFKNIQSNHDVYATFQVENNTSQKIYRFWGARGGHHFYTANDDEFTYVVNNYPNDVWQYEGVGYRSFLTQQAETIPVYRFWSDQSLGHFYTASEEEKNYIIANYPTRVWKFEGIAYKVP